MKLPTGTIFLTKKDGGKRVVTTVIPAQDVEMNVDHLLKCGDCGLRYNGADERCVWCGSKDKVKEIHSNTIRLCDEEIEPGGEPRISDDVYEQCQEEVLEMF
ncbi:MULTISPECIES: hypothetical protein [Halobacterium]|uniref:Small CPxCG-related zinc finger protein n=1 Tax=Halobacterium salinarum (strain ATCC 33171 / DSM 3754 / JCM 8978 / NBRC 102687 / NCIMB 764 / 91-R6) TaxID=2597657 RepID=A0A4D6GX86_HALS9|nr:MULTISPECIES: hypothetical protein [Halobacterium]MCF2166274.1 hypothetical protein [Halobacterium salinarum]MCF2168474.1 hypothetical protein [Halobacterium salinarum]MCF2207117.1 hypothetical protein [Halobacterium salinarum]MCF2240357.1 hypothetical protein [Halobacterium salinarum]MDL0121585.1 hypothetical protein [Halobacterium salinarum]